MTENLWNKKIFHSDIYKGGNYMRNYGNLTFYYLLQQHKKSLHWSSEASCPFNASRQYSMWHSFPHIGQVWSLVLLLQHKFMIITDFIFPMLW